MSKIREVIVLTCAFLFWAVDTTPEFISAKCIFRGIQENWKDFNEGTMAYKESGNRALEGAVKGTEDVLPSV